MTTSELPLPGGWPSRAPQSTSSAEGSPASRSASPASSSGPLTSGGAGPGWLTSYAQYDPATSSWRTSQRSLEIETPSDGCSATFTGSGSMLNGQLYQRAPLVPHTHAAVCTSWRTPVARDYKGYTKREGESICNQLRRMYGGTGRANPLWLEWLMGFPAGWSSIPSEALETLSSPRSPSTSGD